MMKAASLILLFISQVVLVFSIVFTTAIRAELAHPIIAAVVGIVIFLALVFGIVVAIIKFSGP